MSQKPNPNVTISLEQQAAGLRRKIELGRRLESLEGNDGWKAAQELLKDRLRVAEYVLDNYSTYEPRAVDRALCQREDLKYVLDIAEDFKTNSAALSLKLKEITDQINERNSKQQPAK
jgi:hypothetical protein